MRQDGEKVELTHPVEIAGHLAATYEKTFNKQFKSDINTLISFLGSDIDKLGKINTNSKKKLEFDITMSEV